MKGPERHKTVDPLQGARGLETKGSGGACPVSFPLQSSRMRHKRITALFHQLWSKAVSAESYDKREWQELQDLLRIEEMGGLGRGS